MAFYLRKAFKTGPVRLNLSKGGLGLSAGITGARIGINTKGTYVHGGRHGLYYRKYLNQGKNKSWNPVSMGGQRNKGSQTGPIDIFHDTGVTFNSKTTVSYNSIQLRPTLPSSKVLTPEWIFGIMMIILLLIFSLTDGSPWLIIPSLLLITLSIGWVGYHYYWKLKAERLLTVLTAQTEQNKKFMGVTSHLNSQFPDRWKAWLNTHLHAVIGELALKTSEIESLNTLRKLDRDIPLDKVMKDQIRASILSEIIDELLEDHMISVTEEQLVLNLINELNLPEELLYDQLKRLNLIRTVRTEMERPLSEIDPDIPLVRGEKAYELFDEARLLNERVINRFQRNRIQYRELGYEIDIEGKIIITDRRMLFIGRGSREYRLNQLLNITADPEAGIVVLTISNRKYPLVISVKEPLILAARLEMILNEVVNE